MILMDLNKTNKASSLLLQPILPAFHILHYDPSLTMKLFSKETLQKENFYEDL